MDSSSHVLPDNEKNKAGKLFSQYIKQMTFEWRFSNFSEVSIKHTLLYFVLTWNLGSDKHMYATQTKQLHDIMNCAIIKSLGSQVK